MGLTSSANSKAKEDYQTYLSGCTHFKKGHSSLLQSDIDLYHPNFPEFEEDLILIFERAFDETDATGSELQIFRKRQKYDLPPRKKKPTALV